MAILVDLTPTNVQFLFNGKIYRVKEIMESGDDLMLTGEQVKPEPEEDKLIEPNL